MRLTNMQLAEVICIVGGYWFLWQYKPECLLKEFGVFCV